MTALCFMHGATAGDTLGADVQRRLREASFEVVIGKPDSDPLTYEKELPLDLLPFSERTSKYLPIGTAFTIERDRFITAAHVVSAGAASQYGPLAIRNAAGQVYLIDKITKYSAEEDYAEFTVRQGPTVEPLATQTHLEINEAVFAVGNALGEGIVIRDATYTSDTAEERSGRWKWLRFSAATSPGNSGGPLVNNNGDVVGVVIRKSPSENLNEAVAISQVQQGSSKVAKFASRYTYQFPLMQATESAVIDAEVPLPTPIRDFYAALLSTTATSLKKERTQYFTRNEPRTFPHGDGSVRTLNYLWIASFPRVIEENTDHTWALTDPKPQKRELEHSGFIEQTTHKGYHYFRLRLPDDVTWANFENNSKSFMDLLLRAFDLTRQIGPESIRVTSLGIASKESNFRDNYGRPWKVRSWKVPFKDTVMVTAAMATPQGFIVIARECQSYQEWAVSSEIESIAEFTYVSLTGTLKQWQSYMTLAQLSDVLRTIKIHADYGTSFQYESKRLKLTIPETVQDVAPNSMLLMKMTFFQDGRLSAWDVGGIYLADTDSNAKWVDVLRRVRPPDTLPTSSAEFWHTLETGAHPFTATAFPIDGGSRIEAVANAKQVGARQTDIAYTVTVNASGTQEPQEMKNKLDTVQRGMTILEH